MSKIQKILRNSKAKTVLFVFIILLTTLNIYDKKLTAHQNIADSTIIANNSRQQSAEMPEVKLLKTTSFEALEFTASIYDETKLLIYGNMILGALFLVIEFSVIVRKSKSKLNESESQVDDLSLLEDEILVYELIQEYLSGNRYLEKGAVLPYVSSRLSKSDNNLNTIGIERILQSLMDKGFIVDGSKLTKGEVLLNSNRKMVFDFVIDNPGTHFMKIVRQIKLSNFLTRWHLDILIKFNYIRSERIGNQEAYFNVDIPSELSQILNLLSREKCIQIIDNLIANKNGCTKYKLSQELGMHPNTISKYIKQLTEYQLLICQKLPNKVLYFLNEQALQELKAERLIQ